MRVALVNANTNAATTADMLAIVRQAAAPGDDITGLTAAFGAPLIADPAALAVAADAVLALASGLSGFDGVIVAAFGDPGRSTLAARLQCPVVGIAEAGMAAAAGLSNGRFAVATTTPALRQSIQATAERYGHGAALASIRITSGDPGVLMADPAALEAALADAVAAAIREDGARSVVIGGGPLGRAAAALQQQFDIPIVAPLPAAVVLLRRRIEEAAAGS